VMMNSGRKRDLPRDQVDEIEQHGQGRPVCGGQAGEQAGRSQPPLGGGEAPLMNSTVFRGTLAKHREGKARRAPTAQAVSCARRWLSALVGPE